MRRSPLTGRTTWSGPSRRDRRRRRRRRPDRAAAPNVGGYPAVLRDRLARQLLAINVVFVAAGYAQFQLLPVYARDDVHVGGAAIGAAFLINTLIITVAQLPLIAAVGRRRLEGLAVMGLLWGLAWAAMTLAGVFP